MSEEAGSPGNHPEQEESIPRDGPDNQITGYVPVTALTDVGGVPVTSWDEMERVYRNTFHSELSTTSSESGPPPLEPAEPTDPAESEAGKEGEMNFYFDPAMPLDQPVWMRRIVLESDFCKQAEALGISTEDWDTYKMDVSLFAHFGCVRFHPEADKWDGMYIQHTDQNRPAFLDACAAAISTETDFDATIYRTFESFAEAGEFMSNSQIAKPVFFYGIFCGRRTGVFTDPLVVTRLTYNYPEARVRRFESSEAAQLYATNGIWGTRNNQADPHPYVVRRFWVANKGGIAEGVGMSDKGKKGKESKGVEVTSIRLLGLPTDPFMYTVGDVHHNAKGVVSYTVTPNLPMETARKNICYKSSLKVGRAMDHQATIRLIKAVFNTVKESRDDKRYRVPAAMPRMVVFTTDEQYNAAKKVVSEALEGDMARDLCIGLMKVRQPLDLFPIARNATLDDLAAQGAELPALHTEVTRRGLAK